LTNAPDTLHPDDDKSYRLGVWDDIQLQMRPSLLTNPTQNSALAVWIRICVKRRRFIF